MQKQVFRINRGGRTERDILASHEERLEGKPLLVQFTSAGRRVSPPAALESVRERVRSELAQLPEEIRSLDTPPRPFRVELSPKLASLRQKLASELSGGPLHSGDRT